MSISIPYAHVWAILNIDFSGATPPSVVPGPYEDTPAGRARNLDGLKKNDNALFGLDRALEQRGRLGDSIADASEEASVAAAALVAG